MTTGRSAERIRTAGRLDRLVTEDELLETVLETATRFGWWSYHTRDSRRSTPGWVDLVLLKPPCALFVELKKQDGKVSPAQAHVLEMLADCGFEAAVWRPSNLTEIALRLARREPVCSACGGRSSRECGNACGGARAAR